MVACALNVARWMAAVSRIMAETLTHMVLRGSSFLVGLYGDFKIEKFSYIKYFFCANIYENGKADRHWFGFGTESFYYFHFEIKVLEF